MTAGFIKRFREMGCFLKFDGLSLKFFSPAENLIFRHDILAMPRGPFDVFTNSAEPDLCFIWLSHGASNRSLIRA